MHRHLKMNEDISTVGSIAELSTLVESRFKDDTSTTVLYRGHGAASFTLRPKVGRALPSVNTKNKTVNEKLMLELFRRQSVDRVEVAAKDDWELLAIAQHYGLPTRLLDWTRSPLVALYFSVCKECESRDWDGRPRCEDAEIIAWRCCKEDLSKPLPKNGPLKIATTIRYIPRLVTSRLRAQSGVFTVHSAPAQDFVPDGAVVRIRIPREKRQDLKRSLFRHGVHEAVLFPDLDGLARHIAWCQTKCY
jgi:FRG domain